MGVSLAAGEQSLTCTIPLVRSDASLYLPPPTQVRGSLPQPQQPPSASEAASGNSGGPGRWLTPEEAREANEGAAGARQRGKVGH